MRLESIVESIEYAIQNKCYLPALALTLVLPDICAKYDYPHIYSKKESYNNHEGQGAAYAKWYDENIAQYNMEPDTKTGLIDGYACWKLRCEFLHEAYIDLDKIMSNEKTQIMFKLIADKNSNFEYMLGGVSSITRFETDEQIEVIHMQIDVSNFCGQILEVLKHSYLNDEKFISETENKKLSYVELF